jgi:hypothetical protein
MIMNKDKEPGQVRMRGRAVDINLGRTQTERNTKNRMQNRTAGGNRRISSSGIAKRKQKAESRAVER